MPWLKSMTSKGLKCTFTFLARWAHLAKGEKNWSIDSPIIELKLKINIFVPYHDRIGGYF
jgi:hypothetical protein